MKDYIKILSNFLFLLAIIAAGIFTFLLIFMPKEVAIITEEQALSIAMVQMELHGLHGAIVARYDTDNMMWHVKSIAKSSPEPDISGKIILTSGGDVYILIDAKTGGVVSEYYGV